MKTFSNPPRILECLLNYLVHPRYFESLPGDFEEIYIRINHERGKIPALGWYIFQIMKLLPAFIIDSLFWSIVMFNNHLKTAIRNISRNKVFSFINISGLAVGLTCFILILLWVQHELSYDRFHENANEIFRIVEHQNHRDGDFFPVAVTPWPMAQALDDDFPEIVNNARLRIFSNILANYKDKRFFENDMCAVDPAFIEMFSFEFLNGDPKSALSEPQTMVLTESTARKYFGSEDPMGKTITFNNTYDFAITGIIKDIPDNSHLRVNCLVQFDAFLRDIGWTTTWNTNNYTTYVQSDKNARLVDIESKVEEYLINMFEDTNTTLHMQKLTDIHLHSYFAIDLYGHSEDSSQYVYTFFIVAVFVILIACIN
ncbi:ABC transporter permease, partial [candidate division KSB1 bacterium]